MGFVEELHNDAKEKEKGMTKKDYKAMAREILVAAGFQVDPGDEGIEFIVDPDDEPVKNI